MNNNDIQPAKNMYQFPTNTSEVDSLSAQNSQTSSEQIDRQFNDIAREEVRLSFEEITKELARSASGDIEPPHPTIENGLELHPHAVEILRIGADIEALRAEYGAELAARVRGRRALAKLANVLFSNNPAPASLLRDYDAGTSHGFANVESDTVEMRFPSDPHVYDQKFFFLPDSGNHKWYMQQTSTVKTKNFTNSYTVRPDGVEKSSTYYDEREGRIRNVSVTAAHDEILTLKTAATRYHSQVTQKIYKKTTGPRRRIK